MIPQCIQKIFATGTLLYSRSGGVCHHNHSSIIGRYYNTFSSTLGAWLKFCNSQHEYLKKYELIYNYIYILEREIPGNR